jgi:SpoVK/Ycf46/Vps4 family AAA+-type ATPase
VAASYRLSARTIAQRARLLAEGQSLPAQCRLLSRPALEGLARRVETTARWEDLVLPDAQMKTLRLIASQLQHRITVHDDWGFGGAGQRGLGLSALFFGDSGVGKTMACEVIARELDLDLYRIDLSAVVSKYIGETEKNLARVFDAAEDAGAILLFDEADALFGKRSEVKDSHDRYANIEVSYLLQRMETYRGLAVLTSNQRAALDPAFLRRLRFVVQFPFPDAAQRERIWARAFPPAMPRGPLDLAKLARLPMAGGNIRNIALNAAFFAAAEAGPVRMAHLARAAHLEASKQERPLAESQTRGWE